MKKRYSITNGNGTYRIPLTGLNLRVEGEIPCLFGELANLVGQVEDLGNIEELRELVKNCGKQG